MEGELKNCPYCHKVYLDRGEDCCPHCKDKQEAQRQMVREYMDSHLATDLISIAHGTGLSFKTIMRMKREGFLTPQRLQEPHRCKTCGAIIDEGLYCMNCVAAFSQKRADLASRRMRDNMYSGRWGERRMADSKFLVDTFAKYGGIGRPLLKSERARQRRRRILESTLYEYVDMYGDRK
ncbi:hypothetical protein [Selenomonas sp. AB3002]|uniref:hypothetical protein n=1 Tax=Selenomonas sp. AB3002 TaxID=1392502 RepID=UPI000496F7EA